MLYISLIIIIVCIISIDIYFKKTKKYNKRISDLGAESSDSAPESDKGIPKKIKWIDAIMSDNFERNVLLILIFSTSTFFYLANNYESFKEYTIKFSFSKNIENPNPETLREIYNDAMSKDSSLLIEKLIEENPENSELHALAAHYFNNVDTDDYDKDEDEINKKIIYHTTQAINMGSDFEPWLLGMRGRAKYKLKDNNAIKDFQKSVNLFEVLLESSPEDANLLYYLGLSNYRKYGVYQKGSITGCAPLYSQFLTPMQNFKDALNNSSKIDPHINMFGWEKGTLHNRIYYSLEWNARVNIGVIVSNYYNLDYNNFEASKYSAQCRDGNTNLAYRMSSSGFCEIFSKAGEEGYDRAYEVLQKWCN
tara:strand:+ start:228 stop:1322 length:1095 start_codon:yes stop_codon:yes gene_type:complete